MSNFRVGLKKVVDDSYDIEIGYELEEKLVNDIRDGLVGSLHKFAIVTDDIVNMGMAKMAKAPVCHCSPSNGRT